MKRSGFKRPQPERAPRVAYTLARQCTQAKITEAVQPIPKVAPVRSEAYRRLVAALPCIRCGIAGYSQAAHPNTGKGAGTKTSDLLCFPLCACRPGVRGCHSFFDQGALYTREQRRAIEIEWTRATQQAISAAGDWPDGLPVYSLQA